MAAPHGLRNNEMRSRDRALILRGGAVRSRCVVTRATYRDRISLRAL